MSQGSDSRFISWVARTLGTQPQRIRVWQRLIVTSFVVTAILFGARAAHLVEGLETWWLDRMAIADRPALKAPITVIAITDSCFYEPGLFDGMAPLHPATLARIVERALAHHPKGLVFDVEIHPARHESTERSEARLQLYRLLNEAAENGSVPIVLARCPDAERLEPTSDERLKEAWEGLTSNTNLHWADPTIERTGGFVRGVPRRYDGNQGSPTILGAAIDAFHLAAHHHLPWWVHKEEHGPTESWRIRFSGSFRGDTSQLQPHHLGADALLSMAPVEGQTSLLADRIILVGGTYRAGRDLLPTVVGDMAGVYVWAEAIASWIRHDALREPLEVISFLLEFLVGVLTGLLLIRLGPAVGLFAALPLVGLLTVVFSILTFGDRMLFVNFLPAVIGVYLHYQIELHLEIRSLRKQLGQSSA